MKQLFVLALLLSATAQAQTPLTSTDFSLDYSDIPNIQRAQSRQLTPSVLMDLVSPQISNDIRAAIVNALGWSPTRQTRAQQFAMYLANAHSTILGALRAQDLSPQELFALGYLAALDNHMDLRALGGQGELADLTPGQIIDRAIRGAPNDFAMILVRSLVRAQELLIAAADRNTCRAYQEVANVVTHRPSTLRPNALARIMGFMETYHPSCAAQGGRRRRR